jgi:CRP-like cAMP-binding protein
LSTLDLTVLLSENPVFARLEESERLRLAEQASPRTYQKGEAIALYGDLWPYLLLILEGEVDAIKESAEGRRLLVSSFGAGEVFWGLTFFAEEAPMPVRLEARRASRVLLWRRERILPVILAHGDMGWELCRLMSSRMIRASAILEEMAFQPVAGRLANFLVNLSPEDEGPIARSFTLDDMAARVGSTREVVCRFLQRFADRGMIDITRTEFVIIDRQKMEGLAQQVKG